MACWATPIVPKADNTVRLCSDLTKSVYWICWLQGVYMHMPSWMLILRASSTSQKTHTWGWIPIQNYPLLWSPHQKSSKLQRTRFSKQSHMICWSWLLLGWRTWKQLYDHNAKLNGSRCAFLQSEVLCPGLKVNQRGLQPVKKKIEAIANAPTPQNVSQLRSFLDMVQDYSCFLPVNNNVSSSSQVVVKGCKMWAVEKQ